MRRRSRWIRFWQITDKGDQDVRRLADDHYSRQTPGSPKFTRNGQNLVFVTHDLSAAWITFRPTPGKASRPDGLDAWECALFRNVGPVLSSTLVREATLLTAALWGPLPKDGLITYVKPDKIRSTNPGCCYKKAGWIAPPCSNPKCRRAGAHRAHAIKDGKPLFVAPPTPVFWWRLWAWRGERGGRLREELEG